MVKEELGSDAVILHTKRYKKKSGILGLKSKAVVEVTAAVEDNEVPARPPVVRPDLDAGNIRQVIARTRPVAPENLVQSTQPAPKIDIQSTPQPINVLTQYKTAGTAAGVEESAQKAARVAGKKPAISRKLVSGPGAKRQRKKPVASKPLTQPVQYQQPEQPAPEPASFTPLVQPGQYQPAVQPVPQPLAGAPIVQPVQYQQSVQPVPQPLAGMPTVQPVQYQQPEQPVPQPVAGMPVVQPVQYQQPEQPVPPPMVGAPAAQPVQYQQPEQPVPQPTAGIPMAQPVQYQQAEQSAPSPKIILQPGAEPVHEEPVEAAAPPVIEEKEPEEVQTEDDRTEDVRSEDFRPMETTRIIKAAPAPDPAEQEKISALENEVAQLKEMLKKAVEGEPVAEGVVTLKEALLDQDINQQVLEEMIRCMPAGALSLDKDSPEALAAVTQYCKQLLRDPGLITLKAGKPRIVALVGTTGVGKTTTLAKIAAKFVLERGTEVALITADTYRISAVEQLKTYSDIIGLPLEIVYSPSELKSAIRKFRSKGLILIDTAGRNQHNDFQIKELVDLLAVDPAIEKHLVLSATTKERDAVDVMDRFAPVKPDRLLFTKTDETESIGTVVNLISSRRTRVSYFTNGQSVPDDIEAAGADMLASLLLK